MQTATHYRNATLTSMLAAALLLSACAAPQPRGQLDDAKARVTLETRPQDRIEAYRLDGELVDGLRFPDLTPGAHDIRVRHHYEIPGAASGSGVFGEPRWERCIIGVRYADFAGGEHYIFEAGRLGFRSVGWLRSADGEKLADANIISCGPGV